MRTEHSPSRGGIRLTILLATVGALLLVPAAQALATTSTMTVLAEGTGSGEISSVGGIPAFGGIFEGSPAIECSYASPGPTTGVCENEASTAFEGSLEGVAVHAIAAPGSEFVEWAPGSSGLCSNEESECKAFGETGQPMQEWLDIAVFCPEGEPTCNEKEGAEEFPLNITLEGTGEGTVTSTPSGIDCGSECEAEFEEGEEVELSQSPESGSEFVEWGGACSGSGSCEVTMTEAKEVTATFDLEPTPEFALSVTKSGTGTGTVTSTPTGIDCGSECSAEFEEGEEVELSQSASTGSEFKEWTGACSGTGTCEVTMSAAKSVGAKFDLIPRTLTITNAGAGTGAVKCKFNGGAAGACTSPQPNGTTVQLIATATTGSEFAGFSSGTGSATACTTSPCSFTLEANSAVTATFDLEPEPEEEFKLTIAKVGTGSGSVTCNGGSCAAEYPEGEEVTLAASAASGSTFSGWSGGGCSGTSNCTIAIEADTTVTATFTANPKEEAKKEEVKPPPPTEGTAKVAASATVKSGKASLKLTCSGGPCKGTIQLKAKVKQGKKTKNLVIGKASFSIADGASAVVKVKLSGPAKSELAKG